MKLGQYRAKKQTGGWIYGSLVSSKNISPAIYFEVGKINKKTRLKIKQRKQIK
jgi:hypothetical protein